MAKTASLTSGLVAKGKAAPAVTHSVPVSASTEPESAKTADKVAMTVKLTQEQYEELKAFAASRRMKSQAVFVAALDLYLKQAASA
jgi:F0F1-type ATP synthase alpha subunit